MLETQYGNVWKHHRKDMREVVAVPARGAGKKKRSQLLILLEI